MKADIFKLTGVIETIRQVDPELPVHTVLIYLLVADAMPEGILMHELAKKAGVSAAVCQRNVSFLTKEKGFGIPGYDLLTSEIVPQDRRQRRVKLSAKGEKFLAKLMKQLE